MSTQTPTRDGAVLLTPADAAVLAKVSRDTIYREIDRGELRALHVGRQLRIDPQDFSVYLKRGGCMTVPANNWSPNRARGRAAADARACLGSGWLVEGSIPAGCRASRLHARARPGMGRSEVVA